MDNREPELARKLSRDIFYLFTHLTTSASALDLDWCLCVLVIGDTMWPRPCINIPSERLVNKSIDCSQRYCSVCSLVRPGIYIFVSLIDTIVEPCINTKCLAHTLTPTHTHKCIYLNLHSFLCLHLAKARHRC